MPHQCVRCNVLYDDGAKEILSGCSCGARLFFYVNKRKLEQAKQITQNLTKEDKIKIEQDVMEIMGEETDHDAPVVLDLESINIIGPGKFELDLVNLFKKDNPLVYKLEEGKYMIDVAETFRKRGER